MELWIPGQYTDNNGNMALMNAFCGMSQFVVVGTVPSESSVILASNFMQYEFIKFELYHIVVFNGDTPFEGAFIAICQALNLNYDILAKRNYEGISVEYFHRFLNMSVTIAVEERGTTNIFVPTGIPAEYDWNSTPTNDTDILRSIPAIGREVKFPLDININTISKLVQNNANVALDYLKFIDSSCNLFSSILKILMEDRRIGHAERVNNSRNLVVWNTRYIVMARTAIQSDFLNIKLPN